MVRDYVTRLYAPAARASNEIGDPGRATELAAWKDRVRRAWPQVQVEHVESVSPTDADPDAAFGDAVQVGTDIGVSALVRLGELRPADIEVQLVTGKVDVDDQLHQTRATPFPEGTDVDGGLRRYEGTVTASVSGTMGYTIRVVPFHPGLASDAEMGLVALPRP